MNPYNIIELKTQLEYLNDLAETPDIKIMYFSPSLGSARLRAELVLPSGEMIVAEESFSSCCCDDEERTKKLRDSVQEKLLKEIGYNYIKRAFERRKNGETHFTAGDHTYLLGKLKGQKRHLRKLIDLCIMLCNRKWSRDDVISEIAEELRYIEEVE